MIKIENAVTPSPAQMLAIVNGARNSYDSWDKSDSHIITDPEKGTSTFTLGSADRNLLSRLSNAPTGDERKHLRMMEVIVDVTAPMFWWSEADTYKVGTVANSCSKMHTLAKRDLNLSDFSIDHLYGDYNLSIFKDYITQINTMRKKYVDNPEDKDSWRIMLEMLPVSFNQKRTLSLNYEVLKNMYNARKNHKLQEWRDFCAWIETLPYSYLITSSQIW